MIGNQNQPNSKITGKKLLPTQPTANRFQFNRLTCTVCGFCCSSVLLQRLEFKPDDLATLLKLMSCNVCEELPSPTSYRLCAQGHIQCLECVPRRDRCHFMDEKQRKVCQLQLSQVPVSTLYKTLYMEMVFKCPNSENGCNREFRGAQIRHHYDICVFRYVAIGTVRKCCVVQFFM